MNITIFVHHLSMPKTKPRSGTAVAYIRVSTTEQALGPQVQRKAINQWCKQHQIKLVAEPFVDHGVSGGLVFEKRPGLLGAVNALEEHNAEILVAHKRDRIARDMAVIGNLKLILRRRHRRICTTDRAPGDPDKIDPMVTAMEGMSDVFAEHERSILRARTKAVLQLKRSRGERTGSIPYGYRLDKDGVHLFKDGKEQKMVKLVKRLHSQGMSLRKIGEELKEAGFRPKKGKHWGPSTIKKIVEFKPPEKKKKERL